MVFFNALIFCLVVVVVVSVAAQEECPSLAAAKEAIGGAQGLGVVVLGSHYDALGVVEVMMPKIVVAPNWLDVCASVTCLIGAVHEIPLARHAAATIVAVDSWDLATESGSSHARIFREWLQPGGLLVLAQTPSALGNLSPERWRHAVTSAGLIVEAAAGAPPPCALAIVARSRGRAAPRAASSLCDGILAPRCEVVAGVALRTRPGKKNSSMASLYEPDDEPRLLAVRADPTRPWSCRRADIESGLRGALATDPLVRLPKYFSTFSEHVALLVPENATRVLDVGCGAGLFLRKLKAERNLLSRVEGIEPNALAALAARDALDEVYEGHAQDVVPNLLDAAYDAIIFSDVLEHVVHPDLLLRLLAPKLKPRGRICVSVPNMRFWTEFLLPVLDGTWDYAPHGVRDRTHLRWFTHDSFLAMARAGGFVPDGPTMRVHYGDEHKLPLDLARALVPVVGQDATSALFEESDVRQFLVPLRKCGAPCQE
ncbi:hypothetical protein CTAYLR_007848 [Chrysophaeum taylorii]|uniref:Uncharacterized protein n=1 Tax=Chrysophaeum taylorii TaxID=2483200 RepID=A0AAD7XNH8_9STRA|nr:hypothetical protein CTAYLR_007848 [Chrysophaeum taylorii]